MKPSQLWRFHSSSEKYSCSNPLINVCLADVSMETVFTAPQCSKNGSKVIRVPGERRWHRYDGQRRWLTRVDVTCLIQHVCSLCPHSPVSLCLFSPLCLFKAQERGESLSSPFASMCISAPFQPKRVGAQTATSLCVWTGNMETLTASAWLVLCLPAPHCNPAITPYFTPSWRTRLEKSPTRFHNHLSSTAFLPATLRQRIIWCRCYSVTSIRLLLKETIVSTSRDGWSAVPIAISFEEITLHSSGLK